MTKVYALERIPSVSKFAPAVVGWCGQTAQRQPAVTWLAMNSHISQRRQLGVRRPAHDRRISKHATPLS